MRKLITFLQNHLRKYFVASNHNKKLYILKPKKCSSWADEPLTIIIAESDEEFYNMCELDYPSAYKSLESELESGDIEILKYEISNEHKNGIIWGCSSQIN